MADEFFTSDTPHGLVKRIMYKKYLQAFIPITQQASGANGQQLYTTAIIDGFAGAGRYGDEWPAEIERYGSPLIALMVSLNYFYRKQHGNDKIWTIPSTERDSDAEILEMVATMSLSDTDRTNNVPEVTPKIQLYFIEKDDACFDSLKDNIAEVLDYFFPNPDESYIENETEDGSYHFTITNPNYPISCELVNTEFTSFRPPLFIKINSFKCLVFLDPFGFSQTPMTHVKKFVGPGNSLLINFMSSFVNRFFETQPENIVNLYGIRYLHKKASEMNTSIHTESLNEYVKYLVRQFNGKDNIGSLNNIQSCAATYERMLKNVFKTELSLTFEMRGGNNNIIYHLIFVTDHLKSIEVMKEAMNRCAQVEGGLSMSDYQFCRNGCVLNLGNTQDATVVADKIYEKFEGCSKMEISQVKNYVLLETPYVFRKKCLAVIEKEPAPRLSNVVDANGQRPKRKGTYPDHTTWYLTFRPSERTKDLAYFIYETYCRNGNTIVKLHEIKNMLDVPHFAENALLMMATESTPRCEIYYIESLFPEPRYVFSSDRKWYIVFRPATVSQVNGQYQLVPYGLIATPPPQYIRVF